MLNKKYKFHNYTIPNHRLLVVDDNFLSQTATEIQSKIDSVFNNVNFKREMSEKDFNQTDQHYKEIAKTLYVNFNLSNYADQKNNVINIIKAIESSCRFQGVSLNDVNFYFDYNVEPVFDSNNLKAMQQINLAVSDIFITQVYFPVNDAMSSKNIYKQSDNFANTSAHDVDLTNRWGFDEALKANQILNTVADSINQSDLSPYEKYLAVYSFVNNLIYKEENNEHYTSRRIVSILNDDKIVCVGYTQLMTVLLNKVGITAITNTVGSDSKKYYHAINMVKLTDEKYGINGVFEADATFDSRENAKQNGALIKKQYQHHLMPVGNYTRTYKLLPSTSAHPNPVGSVLIKPHVFASTDQEFEQKIDELYQNTHFSTLLNLSQSGFTNYNIFNRNYTSPALDKLQKQLESKGLDEFEIKSALITKGMEENEYNNYKSFKDFQNTIRNTKPITEEQFTKALANVLHKIDFTLFTIPYQNLNTNKLYNNSTLTEEEALNLSQSITKFNKRVALSLTQHNILINATPFYQTQHANNMQQPNSSHVYEKFL